MIASVTNRLCLTTTSEQPCFTGRAARAKQWLGLHKISLYLPATLTFVILAVPAFAAVTVSVVHSGVAAYQDSPFAVDGHLFQFIAPSQVSSAAALATTSTTNYSSFIAPAGGTTIFDWDFTHARNWSYSSYAQSYGDLTFSVDVTSSYDVSGIYQLAGYQKIVQEVWLHDDTAAIYPLSSYNTSNNTPNETLQVGHPGGDSFTSLSGNTTGTLLAGHQYHLNYNYLIETYPNNDVNEVTTATGDLKLVITEIAADPVAAVPEPASLILWGLGGIGCVVGAFRRRKQQA